MYKGVYKIKDNRFRVN